MKNRLLLSLLALLFLLGCVHSGPGKFLAGTAKTVDSGMHSFFVAAELGHVTAEQSNKVVIAYLRYQQSMAVATNAYALSVQTTNQEPWLVASNAIYNSRGLLLQLLR